MHKLNLQRDSISTYDGEKIESRRAAIERLLNDPALFHMRKEIEALVKAQMPKLGVKLGKNNAAFRTVQPEEKERGIVEIPFDELREYLALKGFRLPITPELQQRWIKAKHGLWRKFQSYSSMLQKLPGNGMDVWREISEVIYQQLPGYKNIHIDPKKLVYKGNMDNLLWAFEHGLIVRPVIEVYPEQIDGEDENTFSWLAKQVSDLTFFRRKLVSWSNLVFPYRRVDLDCLLGHSNKHPPLPQMGDVKGNQKFRFVTDVSRYKNISLNDIQRMSMDFLSPMEAIILLTESSVILGKDIHELERSNSHYDLNIQGVEPVGMVSYDPMEGKTGISSLVSEEGIAFGHTDDISILSLPIPKTFKADIHLTI